MRRQKWSQEQELYLKHLKEQKNLGSWKQISLQFSFKFPNNRKSSKQCREKYVNYAKYVGSSVNSTWGEQEDRKLKQCYGQYGSAWSLISSKLNINKSENFLKNRFYNSIKRLSKKIDQHKSIHNEQMRGISSYQSMVRILDFSNQVMTLTKTYKLQPNQESILIIARKQILQVCFCHDELNQKQCGQICKLLKRIKQVNVKLRCFGICKVKNRKNWKLSEKGLNSTFELDLCYEKQKDFLKLNQQQFEYIQIKNIEKEKDYQNQTLNNSKQSTDRLSFPNYNFPYHPYIYLQFLRQPLPCSPFLNQLSSYENVKVQQQYIQSNILKQQFIVKEQEPI